MVGGGLVRPLVADGRFWYMLTGYSFLFLQEGTPVLRAKYPVLSSHIDFNVPFFQVQVASHVDGSGLSVFHLNNFV
jgi:hypothetical protein